MAKTIKKNNSFKLWLVRFWNLIKTYKALIIIFILFFFFTRNQISSFLTPISYEQKESVSITKDSASKKIITFVGGCKVKFSTKNAFLPFEPIDVDITIRFINNELIERTKKDGLIFDFEGADLTNTSINKRHIYNTSSRPNDNDNIKFLDEYASSNATLQLDPNETMDTYTAHAQILYKKSGTYSMSWLLDGVTMTLQRKIEIDSTTELMNKKTNDLLFILTLLNLTLWLYTEFFRKKS